VTRIEDTRNSGRILMGKHHAKCPRLRRRWEEIIKMDFWETGCEDGRWMELDQDHVQWWALVLEVLKLWILLPQC
jgi:hypothetical protein